jgi:periplasmic copper chaperone A
VAIQYNYNCIRAFLGVYRMSGIALILAVAVSFLTPPALAHDYTLGGLKIVHPWARTTPKGSSVGAGYMTIINGGSAPDRLIDASSDIAERIEIHEMRMENGVMKMRAHNGGLEIKQNETVEFNPNSYHLMFVGLRKPLTQGEHVNATLKFEKAGTVNVYFDVEPIGAFPPKNSTHEAMPDMTGH